ncbi:chitinase 4-like protein [Leptotrombidium deliense]|uniref:Chitinase 4-like protein n=1 Tax=Leptotrombidium deliense TaxID=299467 RepID=A0A443S0H7_9ACAR|nr:chitinase 4-like protein [Leptotrombidium deliense]
MFKVLLLSTFILHVRSECWWSGCQPSTWGQRGCYPADTWEEKGSQPDSSCTGGMKYYCCRKGSSYITIDEFKRTATANGYPAPRDAQYNAMCSQIGIGSIGTKQELAMFIAHVVHETGGYQFKEELICLKQDCREVYDHSVGIPGKSYHGRGYLQLSHSYNYKPASEALFPNDPNKLINNPELVASDENIAWSTAFWFWRDRVRNKPNVLQFWFGSSTRAINGGIECDGWNKDAARKRFTFYKVILNEFRISAAAIENGCYN